MLITNTVHVLLLLCVHFTHWALELCHGTLFRGFVGSAGFSLERLAFRCDRGNLEIQHTHATRSTRTEPAQIAHRSHKTKKVRHVKAVFSTVLQEVLAFARVTVMITGAGMQ